MISELNKTWKLIICEWQKPVCSIPAYKTQNLADLLLVCSLMNMWVYQTAEDKDNDLMGATDLRKNLFQYPMSTSFMVTTNYFKNRVGFTPWKKNICKSVVRFFSLIFYKYAWILDQYIFCSIFHHWFYFTTSILHCNHLWVRTPELN